MSLVESLGLVDRQQHGLPAAARQLRDELILGVTPARPSTSTIKRSASPMARSVCAIIRLSMTSGVFDQTAGIDHDARHIGAPGEPVLPVTGQSRQIGDQRIARAGHGIEQRRLAHIRSTDQCDDGQHAVTTVLAVRRWIWASRGRRLSCRYQ